MGSVVYRMSKTVGFFSYSLDDILVLSACAVPHQTVKLLKYIHSPL